MVFDNLKATVARDVVLAYPDYSQDFEIYTDALSKQLGAVITQGTRPIAFFNRKLTEVQQHYIVTKIELLAIVETIEVFKGMLWGQRIKVFTDHKHLIQVALGLTSDRVYWWRLLLEEFGPKIMHIKGIHNTVVDVIFRLDFGQVQDEKANWMTFTKCWCHYTMHAPIEESTHTRQHQIKMVFANHSEEDVIYPLTVKEIAQAQEDDAVLKKLSKTDKYSTQLVENIQVLCKDGKMVIPKVLQHRAVSWYHHYLQLQHPGHTHLEEKLHTVMYWKGMRCAIQSNVKNCHTYQGRVNHHKLLGSIVCGPHWTIHSQR